MPFPNFHSCRLEDPSKFEKGSFRTIKRGEIQLVVGKLKGSSKTRAQAVRYPASMDVSSARAKCKVRGGSFEPAKKVKESILEVIENMPHDWMSVHLEISTQGVSSSFSFYQPGEDVLVHVRELVRAAAEAMIAYEPQEEESAEAASDETDSDTPVQEATWDQNYINNLPDSAFAVVLPGGKKDESGRTTPRTLRKLPHHNAEGKLDLPHLRNALARLSQTDIPAGARKVAERHLDAHAKQSGIGKESQPA